MIVRYRDLLRVMQEWQKLLGLRDWLITLEIVPKGDLGKDDANVLYCVEDRTAKIRVERGKADMELLVLHELFHLWTGPIRHNPKTDLVEEQAIEALTRALLVLKRGDDSWVTP